MSHATQEILVIADLSKMAEDTLETEPTIEERLEQLGKYRDYNTVEQSSAEKEETLKRVAPSVSDTPITRTPKAEPTDIYVTVRQIIHKERKLTGRDSVGEWLKAVDPEAHRLVTEYEETQDPNILVSLFQYGFSVYQPCDKEAIKKVIDHLSIFLKADTRLENALKNTMEGKIEGFLKATKKPVSEREQTEQNKYFRETVKTAYCDSQGNSPELHGLLYNFGAFHVFPYIFLPRLTGAVYNSLPESAVFKTDKQGKATSEARLYQGMPIKRIVDKTHENIERSLEALFKTDTGMPIPAEQRKLVIELNAQFRSLLSHLEIPEEYGDTFRFRTGEDFFVQYLRISNTEINREYTASPGNSFTVRTLEQLMSCKLRNIRNSETKIQFLWDCYQISQTIGQIYDILY
ncbi:hypothetical protein JXB41_07570 [Candidatus Woesearchaeota archaeon]|nr:hypothetical protein [Candidatus Woesearchaeota archaeon]